MCASSPCRMGKAGSEARPGGFRGGGRELGVCQEESVPMPCCGPPNLQGCAHFRANTTQHPHSPAVRVQHPQTSPELHQHCAPALGAAQNSPWTACDPSLLQAERPHTIPWYCTCILVFTTSKGVLPKTLAAPARAPNTPVTKGLMTLLGSSPGKEERLRAEWWWGVKHNILEGAHKEGVRSGCSWSGLVLCWGTRAFREDCPVAPVSQSAHSTGEPRVGVEVML